MNRQEEIRQGVEKLVSEAYWYEGEKNVVVSITKELIEYLDSQGVVIKVERELPDLLTTMGGYISPKITQQNMLNAGYTAVERLIEVKE